MVLPGPDLVARVGDSWRGMRAAVQVPHTASWAGHAQDCTRVTLGVGRAWG